MREEKLRDEKEKEERNEDQGCPTPVASDVAKKKLVIGISLLMM